MKIYEKDLRNDSNVKMVGRQLITSLIVYDILGYDVDGGYYEVKDNWTWIK